MSRPLSSPRLAAVVASLLAAALCACAVFWVAFVLVALPEPVAAALALGAQVVLQVLVARALLGVGRRLLPAHLAYAFASWTGACVLILAGAPASSALGTVALTAMPAGAVLCGLWAASAPRRAAALRERGRRALDAEARRLATAARHDGGARRGAVGHEGAGRGVTHRGAPVGLGARDPDGVGRAETRPPAAGRRG